MQTKPTLKKMYSTPWVRVPISEFKHLHYKCFVCGGSQYEGKDLTPQTTSLQRKRFASVRCVICKTAIGSYNKTVSADGRILDSPEKIEWDENFETERDQVFIEANKKLKEKCGLPWAEYSQTQTEKE